jgi:hypothetical protein
MSLEKKTERNIEKKKRIEEKIAKREADRIAYEQSVKALDEIKTKLNEANTKLKEAKPKKVKVKPTKEPNPEKKERLLFGIYHFNWHTTWIETYKYTNEKEGIKKVRTEIGRYTLIIPALAVGLLILIFGV